MNLLSPAEIAESYADIGAKKASCPAWRLLALGLLGGFLIGMGSAVSNTATHSIDNVSVSRIICGLLFPFGLCMAMLLGAEVFNGNCMLPISVLERKATISGMLKNWICSYTGNLIGAGLLAAGCAYFGQMNYSKGGLAVYAIKVASDKCSLSFASGFVLGFFCNLLVCVAVLCSLSAKDTAGRILGAYTPIAFFVICGFENSVADMFYIPAGLFAASIPQYASLTEQAGVSPEMLTWGNYFLKNLLPVTLGNLVGGVAIGLLMWACYLRGRQTCGR